jgi:alkylated DNA repair dioxygenase AlkB
LSLSVGQSRQFLVRNNLTRKVTPIMLHNGDLLYMGGYVQSTHQHMLPPAAGSGPRLNFTWRRILPPAADGY